MVNVPWCHECDNPDSICKCAGSASAAPSPVADDTPNKPWCKGCDKPEKLCMCSEPEGPPQELIDKVRADPVAFLEWLGLYPSDFQKDIIRKIPTEVPESRVEPVPSGFHTGSYYIKRKGKG